MPMKCPKCHHENPDDTIYCGKCTTPLKSSEDIEVTETIEAPKEELTRGTTFANRYEIIEELGKGGMGRVYRVEDTKLKQEIALKLIKPEIAKDKKTIERFRNELKLAREIAHRNVCRMYDLNEEKGTHYITMEYVRGEDLRSSIRRFGQLPTGKSISIAKQICEGLAEAHRLGVVHRDLKSNNIMIDKEGNVRIMDFGIARSLEAKRITGAGVMIGTPEYMSPEQVEGKEIDQRSDIYSLGVILYEMVTGRVPFEGDTPFTIGMKHKGEIPQNPKELNTQISDDLSLVILKCLEKDKHKRYMSSEEVRSELANIEKGIPTTEKVLPKRKPITSKEITVTFGLKKLFIPALVVVVLAIIAVIIWQLLPKREVVSIEPSKPSIAVLPFEDLSPQEDQGYLCDGFAESIINRLTKVKDLRIPARTSSFSFKGRERNIQDISEKLDVQTVLEGSVQKSGDMIRITTQLINVADGSILWSEQYNRKLDDVFAVQDEITFAIVDELKVNLLKEERIGLQKRDTENLEAYNLYLKGRFFWNKRTEEGIKKAIEYFEQAIEVDRNYALAYAGIADCYAMLPFYGGWSREEAYSKARSAALKALEIESMLAEIHTSLGYIKGIYDWDWSGAEREFKRAILLNPGYSNGHHWYAELLKTLGRVDEAIKEIKIAIELDPLSIAINRNFGVYLYLARRYDEAIRQLRKTLEMDPGHYVAHVWLGYTYLQKGMFEEAIEIFQRYESPRLAYAFTALDKRDEALAVLEDFKDRSSQQYVDPCDFAIIYLGLGEMDLAFEALEKAYQERSPLLVDYIYVDPFFDSVRSDPRFKALIKKLGLE